MSEQARPNGRGSTDAIGMWFAAVAVIVFLAAGVIIYRTANQDDIVTASNDVPAAAKAGPVMTPPLPAR